jgi:hypothetical protein
MLVKYQFQGAMVRIRLNLPFIAGLALLMFSTSSGHSQQHATPSSLGHGSRTAPISSSVNRNLHHARPHSKAPHQGYGIVNVRPKGPVRHFGSQTHRGPINWRQGVWRHEKRGGRYGWWWNTGGFAYFYDVPTEGPPDYISEIAEPDSAIEPNPGEPYEAVIPDAAPPAPPHVRQAYYYSAGVVKGTYNTLKECDEAQKSDPHGVCIWK